MDSNYEIVRYRQGLNARILIHSIGRFKLHWHTEIEILLVLKGRVTLNIGGRRCELGEDDLYLVNSGELHSTAGNGENIVAAIQINPEFCQKYFTGFEKIVFAWPVSAADAAKPQFFPAMRTLIARIMEEYRVHEDGYKLAIEGLLNELLVLLLRNVPHGQQDETRNLGSGRDVSRLQRITEFIQTHYMEKITLGQLAQMEYLSVYYLSHFFKEKLGVTFQEYLTYVRLQKAISQLSQPGSRINDIALDCGFASAKAFNKAFREIYNATPGEYRRQELPLSQDEDAPFYLEFDTIQALARLQSYLLQPPVAAAPPPVSQGQALFAKKGVPEGTLFNAWKRLGSVGRAYDCLRADLQAQLHRAVRELGLQYLRFHGIFSDEMRVVERDSAGKLHFCWQYTDKVLDALLSMGLRPIPDLTFMPEAMKSSESTIFWYKGNTDRKSVV